METAKNTRFSTAAEVRQFCKAHGFAKVCVRHHNSPFGGEGIFFVARDDLPAGVCVVTASGSREPLRAYSDDKGETARMINDLADLLRTTANARISA